MDVLVVTEGWGGAAGQVIPAELVATASELSYAKLIDQNTRGAGRLAGGNFHALVLPAGGPNSAAQLGLAMVPALGTAHVKVYEWPGNGLILQAPVRFTTAAVFDVLEQIAAQGSRQTVFIPVGDVPAWDDATEIWAERFSHWQKLFQQLSIRVLVTSDRPLLGLNGLSASHMEGQLADEYLRAASMELERFWQHQVERVRSALPTRLAGPDLWHAPGSGAAGGLAFLFAALGAEITPATRYFLQAQIDSQERLSSHRPDIVIGISPQLDVRSAAQGTPAAVAAYAGGLGVPAVALVTTSMLGKRDQMALGLAGVHQGDPELAGLRAAFTRLAHTWLVR